MNSTDSIRMTSEISRGDRTCPVCGEDHVTTFDNRHTFEYGSGDSAVTLQVDLPVHQCQACDFEFLEQEGERIKHEAVCRHLAVLTSDEIRRIREQYGMTRLSFSKVTGLGVATLNRWENGVLIQSRANDLYLRLLAMPDIFERLSHLPDRPFPSPEIDFEARGDRQDFSKATGPITNRPPTALARVHLKSYGGSDSRDMSAVSKQMTLLSQVFPRKAVKGIPIPPRVVGRAAIDGDHAKPTPPIRSLSASL